MVSKTPDQILRFLVERISHIYDRPPMYCPHADCLDTILDYYHELWAEILDRGEEYRSIYWELHIEMGCGSKSFSGYYRERHGEQVPERDVMAHVVRQWKRIGDRLGMEHPEG